ncbi:hypothetical protein HYU93_01930 [Candidatus Daviesbacteria bacterium]|nr:hypothetical protein [Candidatus Daviesbacteria bacterium]
MSKEIGPYLYLREDVHPPVCRPGVAEKDIRIEAIEWYRNLDSEQRILHIMLRGQIFGLLGVDSYFQIQDIIEHPELRPAASKRFMEQLGLMNGIKDPVWMRHKCEEYAGYADATRDHLQAALSYPGSANLEMINEVRTANDPTDLLLLALDGRWTPKARWDAKVKLQLMGLVANIDNRQRKIGIEDQFQRFVNWMHERIWNPESLLGETHNAFLISTHDPQTWACIATRWVDEEEGVKTKLQPFQKKIHLPQRSFRTDRGRAIDIYVTIRDKPMPIKTEKMLRKRAEDPAIAVDDDTGLLAVVDDVRDARRFVSHLIRQGYQSNYPIIIEDISYTLNGGEYTGNHGSSPKLRMMKFFIKLANEMRVECIIHTPETYAESLYMKGVSHPEYRLNRLIDSGVPELIFPPKYFPHYDKEQARKQNVEQIRANIEGA